MINDIRNTLHIVKRDRRTAAFIGWRQASVYLSIFCIFCHASNYEILFFDSFICFRFERKTNSIVTIIKIMFQKNIKWVYDLLLSRSMPLSKVKSSYLCRNWITRDELSRVPVCVLSRFLCWETLLRSKTLQEWFRPGERIPIDGEGRELRITKMIYTESCC